MILLHDITSSRGFILWKFYDTLVSIKNIQKSFFPIEISNGIREDIGV